jgi:hypothetical protein
MDLDLMQLRWGTESPHDSPLRKGVEGGGTPSPHDPPLRKGVEGGGTPSPMTHLSERGLKVGDSVPPWPPSQKGGWRWGDSVPPWSPSQKGGWRGGRSPPWEIMGYHKFWCHFHPHDFLHIHWVFLLKFTNEHISQCSSTSTTSTFHVNYMSTINDVYKYLL